MFKTITKNIVHKVYIHFVFRLNQCFRIFNFNPKVSLPFILIFGVLMVVTLSEAILYPLLYFSLVAFFHYNRKDIPFLKKIFINNWRIIIFLESAFIYGILLLSNINYTVEKFGLLFFVALFLLCFLEPKSKPLLTISWNFIPSDLFEWRTYLRKNAWLFILTYPILIASAYHRSSLILCGLLLFGFIAHVYENNENKELLEMYFKKITFKEKIFKNIRFLNIILLPTYIGFIILNFNDADYLFYYILFMNVYLLLVLTRKYKVYHHQEKTNDFNFAVSIEYFMYSFLLIPAIIIIFINRKEAEQNIKSYVGN